MSYRAFLLVSSGFGVLPALAFTVLYVFFDKPQWRDRYASLILGLGIVSLVGFAVPFLLALFSDVVIVGPDTIWRWGLSVVIRGIAGGFMWWLLWIYLTPGRARIRLGRFGPMRQGSDVE